MASEYTSVMLSRLRASHPHWIIRLIQVQDEWLGELLFDGGYIILASHSPEIFAQRMTELEKFLNERVQDHGVSAIEKPS